MAKSKTISNLHATRYVQAVFEKRLREEGFSCPNEKLLCWYRVVNGEVLNTLIFRSNYSNLPLMLDITYEISPLFTKPFYIPSVHYNFSTWERRDLIKDISLMELSDYSNIVYNDPDIMVYATEKPGRGIDRFDEKLLPLFNRAKTVADCYQSHKADKLKIPSERLLEYKTSREFVEEVLYVGDEEFYPLCMHTIEKELNSCRWYIARKAFCWTAQMKRSIANAEEELPYWEQLEAAFFRGERDAYLRVLEQRKQETIKFLKKRVGIEI